MIDTSLVKLNELLMQQFQATEADFPGKAKAVAAQLPAELGQALKELVERRTKLTAEADPALDQLADFAFQAGRTYEQLSAYRQIEMEMENVLVSPDSITATPLQASQVEPLARFIEARDRIFRKVADFTLKALLVLLGLLTLALVLGLL